MLHFICYLSGRAALIIIFFWPLIKKYQHGESSKLLKKGKAELKENQ